MPDTRQKPSTRLTPSQAARINEFGRNIVEAFAIAKQVQREHPEVTRLTDSDFHPKPPPVKSDR
jgi:hypothetical protein